MASELHLALYQPDIPGNAGTILRMAACLGLTVDLIEPAGFDLSDRALRRAGMDYLAGVVLRRHVDFAAFAAWRAAAARRLILFTTQAQRAYTDFAYRDRDVLLFGRESAGVPGPVHEIADHRVLIPMPGRRPQPQRRPGGGHGRRRGPAPARQRRSLISPQSAGGGW